MEPQSLENVFFNFNVSLISNILDHLQKYIGWFSIFFLFFITSGEK